MRDTPFRQKVGPGELEIPAVRGMGGSLFYFLDPTSELGKVWDIEFEPVKGVGGRTGAGLTVVDHISQSTHYEDMLSWLLFYTSLLDVTKTPQVDITDPGGIVRSQVIESARWRVADRVECLAEPAHAVVALSVRIFRLGRSAHCLRHR